jgi:Restriction endonuclease
MAQPKHGTKRIAPGAYDALVEALAAVFWNKVPFERFLRLTLRDHPEVLSGLTFDSPKRQVASDLVMHLGENEERYQAVTLSLMLQLSTTDDFPNLRAQADRDGLIAVAMDAVAELRKWTTQYGDLAAAQEKLLADQEAERASQDHRRSVSGVLQELEKRFLAMHAESDHQQRGRTFEGLLNELFFLFDMNPRKSFVLADEQIDGAFTFSTDDYLLEAKWETTPASREAVDVLAQKVQRKGKNTLGLFVAVSGFSPPAVSAHSNCGTGLIFMDGTDLLSVLNGVIPLTDVLEAKRRHVSETGLPLLSVREMLG